jgi:hypothetical protein
VGAVVEASEGSVQWLPINYFDKERLLVVGALPYAAEANREAHGKAWRTCRSSSLSEASGAQ